MHFGSPHVLLAGTRPSAPWHLDSTRILSNKNNPQKLTTQQSLVKEIVPEGRQDSELAKAHKTVRSQGPTIPMTLMQVKPVGYVLSAPRGLKDLQLENALKELHKIKQFSS